MISVLVLWLSVALSQQTWEVTASYWSNDCDSAIATVSRLVTSGSCVPFRCSFSSRIGRTCSPTPGGVPPGPAYCGLDLYQGNSCSGDLQLRVRLPRYQCFVNVNNSIYFPGYSNFGSVRVIACPGGYLGPGMVIEAYADSVCSGSPLPPTSRPSTTLTSAICGNGTLCQANSYYGGPDTSAFVFCGASFLSSSFVLLLATIVCLIM